MKDDFPKSVSGSIDWSVSICAPAVRLLIISAWSDGGKADYRLIPVVAIQSRVRTIYDRKRKGPNDYYSAEESTHKEMIDSGFRSGGRNVAVEPIVVDDYSCLSFYQEDCSNQVSRLVACPWGAEEDEIRLKEQIDEVLLSAIDKEANSERALREKKAKEQPAT